MLRLVIVCWVAISEAQRLVVVGPSLSGKTAFAEYLKRYNFTVMQQYTTRPIRSTEHADAYKFTSHRDFALMTRYQKQCATRWYYPPNDKYPWFYWYDCADIVDRSVLISDIRGALSLKSAFNNVYVICFNMRPITGHNRRQKLAIQSEQGQEWRENSYLSRVSGCDSVYDSEEDNFYFVDFPCNHEVCICELDDSC